MRKAACIALLASALAAASAQGLPSIPDLAGEPEDEGLAFEAGAALSYDGSPSTKETGGLVYSSPGFALEALLSMNNDGKYSPMHASVTGGHLGNNYFFLEGGGAAVSLGDLSLRAGRLPHHDVVDSPYSLFANGAGLPATIAELSFERGHFFYQSRWVGLNHHSASETAAFPEGYPERGANIKTYGIKAGDMRFGLQDAASYSTRYFDLDYFIDPMPSYFVQYANCLDGRPWSNGYDDNAMVGAFWTWESPEGASAYAQFLLDDFNVFGLFGSPLNPWKIAWSLGGTRETPYGSFGLYQAGATKYAFEPTYEKAGSEYGYAYYPDTTFKLGGKAVAIPFEDMMVGYRHGENNLALMATWADTIAGLDLGASCELTLSGSKSPANAWHEPTTTDYTGTKLLDEAVLEKKALLTLGASRAFGSLLVFCQASLGYVLNELELAAITPVKVGKKAIIPGRSYVEIWKPSDTDRALYSITIGGSYRLGI
jgi:hypothetical protein